MAFATLAVDFVAKIASFEEGMNRAKKSVDSLESRFVTMGRSVSGVLAGLGVGIGVGGLAAMVKSAIDAQDELSKLSQKTGIAVETLAGLQHAADLSGVEVDQLAKGVRTFSVLVDKAANGQKSYQDKLVSLGLNYKQLKDLSPEEQFYALADAVSKLSKEDRAAAVAGLLGDRMSILVPLLSGGADSMRDLVAEGQRFNPVTEESARQAEAFNDNLTRLKASSGRLGISLANELLPPLSRVIERLVTIDRLRDSGASLFEIITGKVSADTKSSLDRVNKDIADLEAKQRRLGTASLSQSDNAELERLKKVRKELQLIAVERIQGTGSAGGGDSGSNSDRANCIASGGVWDGKKCRPKSSAGAKADPLASLLGSTDIGRLREFDKQVALLNQRFNYGKKDTELYTQAMTKLVESTFSNNFKQAADDAEFFRMVEADGIKTTLEWKQNLDDLANVDMSRLTDLLSNTSFAKLKKDQEDMILLARAFSEGIKDADGNLRKLSESEYLDAVATRLGLAKDKVAELDTFAKTAAENIQNSFADFLFDPFDKGLKGMAQSFGQTIQRMIANAVAADLTKRLFGDLVQGGSGSGLAGGLLKSVGSLLSFDGGGYTGDGSRSGGIDGKGGFLSVIHPRETVVDHTRGQSVGGGHTINVYVSGGSAPDVRRAAGQGAREALGMLEGARRYG